MINHRLAHMPECSARLSHSVELPINSVFIIADKETGTESREQERHTHDLNRTIMIHNHDIHLLVSYILGPYPMYELYTWCRNVPYLRSSPHHGWARHNNPLGWERNVSVNSRTSFSCPTSEGIGGPRDDGFIDRVKRSLDPRIGIASRG